MDELQQVKDEWQQVDNELQQVKDEQKPDNLQQMISKWGDLLARLDKDYIEQKGPEWPEWLPDLHTALAHMLMVIEEYHQKETADVMIWKYPIGNEQVRLQVEKAVREHPYQFNAILPVDPAQYTTDAGDGLVACRMRLVSRWPRWVPYPADQPIKES